MAIMKPGSGSGDIMVQDITWSISWEWYKKRLRLENIVESGSRMLDGMNTEGIDDFVPGEFISYGDYIRVPMIWMNCAPELGDRLELYVRPKR